MIRVHWAVSLCAILVVGAAVWALPGWLATGLLWVFTSEIRHLTDDTYPTLQLLTLTGASYLTRWNLVSTPWFRVYVHRIDGPDPDRAPHNHPTDWCCFVLWGGYTHVRVVVPATPMRTYTGTLWGYPLPTERIRWWNYMTTDIYHRITDVKPYTWTLCFSGPRKDTAWGFLVREGVAGFRHVDHKEYAHT